MKYRTSMQITESILQATQDGGQDGIIVTKLIRASNLPTSRLAKFTTKLIGTGLMNKIEQKNGYTFVITQKGRVCLEEYKKFNNIAESFGLEL